MDPSIGHNMTVNKNILSSPPPRQQWNFRRAANLIAIIILPRFLHDQISNNQTYGTSL
jgi:hypothetical protein